MSIDNTNNNSEFRESNLFGLLALVLHSSGGEVIVPTDSVEAYNKFHNESDCLDWQVARQKNEDGSICVKLIDRVNYQIEFDQQ